MTEGAAQEGEPVFDFDYFISEFNRFYGIIGNRNTTTGQALTAHRALHWLGLHTEGDERKISTMLWAAWIDISYRLPYFQHVG